MSSGWALAFTAGVLAAFNPCGFALLPTYLTMFLSGRQGGTGVLRALAVGAWVTAGFVLTFGVAGIAVSALSVRFGTWLSVVTVVLGVGLVAVGAVMLSGREVSVRLPRAKLTVSDSPLGMFSYGVVYATVSLSCTLPVFLAAVATSFRSDSGIAAGTASFVAYALGMGSVLTALALALAIFQESAAARVRRITPHIQRLSAVFLIAAGAYVVWYGVVEYRSFTGDIVTGGPTAWVAEASTVATQWLSRIPILAVPLLLLVLVSVGLLTRWWRSRPGAPTGEPDAPQPSVEPTVTNDVRSTS